ncbi:MAG: 23S rRNA (guanosine(2251)-2'-O)-methyltransferase RlmB [Bacteroidia bacterium]|nr:23S rRNA (guanosine(2251)-2'-O)-methyltransferase RlmB [Bacteroidia bacterium]
MQRKQKTKPNKQLIYGLHAVIEAIQAGKEFERIYILKGEKGDLFNELAALIKKNRLPVHQVPIHKLNRLTRGNHQGAVAFLSIIPNVSIGEIITRTFEQGEDPKILVLDGVTDVRNFGALSRSALAFGFHAVVVPHKGSAMIHQDAVKASAGALMKIPVAKVSQLGRSLVEMKDFGLKIVGITEKATDDISSFKTDQPMALVLGNEETGIYPGNLELCDATYRIRISDEIDSLNVSVAGAISMYQTTI